MKYGQRLRVARKHAKLTQDGLAEAIDNVCTQENISKLERGNATGSEFTVQFAVACNINPVWLATGAGEMADWYYVADRKMGTALQLLEKLPPYGIDHAIKEIAETKELLDHAEKGAGDPTSNSA